VTRAGIAAACVLAAATTARAASFRVTSPADSGPGTLRAAIEAANDAPGSTIHVALGEQGLIVVGRALPPLKAAGIRLDGGGVTLREGDGCSREGGRNGCDGIVVTGESISVSHLRVAGFTFDGVTVLGADASDVRITHVEAIDNLDDGIGVSEGAGPVTIERCLLMGNGFRTKGKGLLVFATSTATLRDSDVIGNRDGITVTQGSKAVIERVIVAGSFDKGLGVSGASLRARSVQVVASGRNAEVEEDVPNGDGLRVGLAGSAELSDCRIAGSEDAGVVVLDTSTATLRDCVVEANRGRETMVAATARLRRRR